jgi:septum formation protein
LRAAGYDFAVRPGRLEEWPYRGGDPAAYAVALARAKAASVAGELVVGADTIVVLDGQVLGKPGGVPEAVEMLRRLSGRAHQVITAVALKAGARVRSRHASAEVVFRPLGQDEIETYVSSGEPLDKAGGYAYQGGAAGFVTRLEGDPQTVIGLPVALLRQLLAESPGRRVGDEAGDRQ